MNTSNTTPLRKEQAVMELFKESWESLSKHALSFVLLSLIPVASFVGLSIVVFILLYSIGFNFEFFRSMLNSDSALQSIKAWQWVLAGSISLFSMIAFVVVSAVSRIGMVIVAGDQASSVSEAMKKGLGRIVPLIVTGICTSLLLFGSFFVFMIPVFIIGFFFIFVQFEVILNGKNLGGAIKRSVSLVARNFGYVFTRVFIYLVIMIFLNVFIPRILLKAEPATGMYVAVYSLFVGLVLSWYALLYFVKMYMHIKDQQEEVSTAWVYIISFLGWLILFVVSMLGYKVFGKTIQEKMNSGTTAAQTATLGEQKYIDESQKLFDEMRIADEKSTGLSDDEIIAKVSALNDKNIAVLKEGVKKYPKSAKIWYQLGNAHTWRSNSGTLEDGLAAYRKAEKLEPKNVPYINGVGDMLILMGKNEEAVLQLQKSLRLTKKSGFAYLSLAQAYRNMKLYSEARKNYKLSIDVFTSENSKGTFDARILQAQREMAALP
ncbi:MAG: hypothetical protein NUV65_03395 [Candidatus Roizmanbacteria bacterium]|nr:hypothetical protein [Candidatus Roizmanbacteria bacterium]